MSTRTARIVAIIGSFLVFATATPTLASEIGANRQLGLGVGGGTMSTTGLTAKSYLGPRSAVQGFLEFNSWGGYGIGVDYLREFNRLSKGRAGELFWGAGIGGSLSTYPDYFDGALTGLAVAAVVEFGWHFREVPREFIVDVRPGLRFGGYYDYNDNYHRRFPRLVTSQGAIRWYF